jgi:hypothetical protein
MTDNLMLLPSREFQNMRLVRIPEDFEEHEAFRYATGLIAQAEENNPDCSWEDIAELLESHGFLSVDFVLGPEIGLCSKS